MHNPEAATPDVDEGTPPAQDRTGDPVDGVTPGKDLEGRPLPVWIIHLELVLN